MKKQRRAASNEAGFTLVYSAVVLTGVLMFSGLAPRQGPGLRG